MVGDVHSPNLLRSSATQDDIDEVVLLGNHLIVGTLGKGPLILRPVCRREPITPVNGQGSLQPVWRPLQRGATCGQVHSRTQRVRLLYRTDSVTARAGLAGEARHYRNLIPRRDSLRHERVDLIQILVAWFYPYPQGGNDGTRLLRVKRL
jgi:hypothetical protein